MGMQLRGRAFALRLLQIGFFVLGYVVVARVALLLTTAPGNVTPVWPISGIVVAVLLRVGYGWWPIVLFGDAIVAASLGNSPLVVVGLASATTAEVVLSTLLLQRFLGSQPSLERLRDVFAFIGVLALVSVPTGALIGVSTLYSAGIIPLHSVLSSWATWWVGNLMGALTFMPLLLAWQHNARLQRPWYYVEAICLSLALLLVTITVFNRTLDYVYLLFPLSIWAALRFSARGAAVAISVVSVVAITFTTLGHGPFAASTLAHSLVFLQTFLGIFSCTTLVLGALVAERQRATTVQQLLTDINGLLASGGDEAQLLDRVSARVAQTLADWCVIDLIGPTGQTQRAAIGYAQAAWAPLAHALALCPPRTSSPHNPIAPLSPTTVPSLIPANVIAAMTQNREVLALLERLWIRSTLVVPLVAEGRTLGVMTMYATTSAARFRSDDAVWIEQLAYRLASVLDVARRASQTAQAQKLEALGQLSGGIAHDFNNLLTVITNCADLALRDAPTNDKLRNEIVEIKDTSQRASKLARQIMLFAQRQPSAPQPIDLNRLVAEMHPLLQHLIDDTIQVVVQPAPEALVVEIDPVQFEQVLVNVVANARDAMPQGGTLTITTAIEKHDEQADDAAVVLMVTDTGVGMDEQTKARVFDPFFTTKTPTQHMGLGLSTSYGIITQSRGTITFQSALGRGTTCTIRLPQPSAPLVTLPEQNPPSPEVQLVVPKQVLLVEDTPDVRRVLVRVLQAQGYQVFAAGDGLEALDQIKTHNLQHLDLLVTDLMMPHMNGLELAEQVRVHYPAVKVLIISGYADNVDFEPRESTAAYLPKPFRPSDLRNVQALLDTSAAHATAS
jgi:signal transduction histidine kinase/integral membrane sensor domain MASE1/ActR/RegA family two-component response regulator